jgi:hypothetical protein
LPPDKAGNDHDSTVYDCWHCFLVFNICLSHALKIGTTQPLSCFVFHLNNLLLIQNFVYATLFSSVPPPSPPPPPPPPPAIDNDQYLKGREKMRAGEMLWLMSVSNNG